MDNRLNMTKFQVSVTMILFLFFSITGATYAYFYAVAENTGTITGNAATVNLTMSVDKIFPTSTSTNTGVMVPQLSTSGSNTSPLASALKSGCVDSNSNIVCQVYKISVMNDGGTATQVVDGIVSFYSNSALTTDITTSMPNLKWKLIDEVDATTPSNSVLGTEEDLQANFAENVFADEVSLSTNQEEIYYMIIWVNETNSDQTDKSSSGVEKIFYGKIEFGASNGNGVTSVFSALGA